MKSNIRKLTFSKLRFVMFKIFASSSVIGEWQLLKISLRSFKFSGRNFEIGGIEKEQYKEFFLSISRFWNISFLAEMHAVSSSEKRYGINFMIGKESLNFLRHFYSHLWLLQGFICTSYKNFTNWVWCSSKFKLGKILTDFFGQAT